MSKTCLLCLALIVSASLGWNQSAFGQQPEGDGQSQTDPPADNIFADCQDSMLLDAFPALRTLIDLLSQLIDLLNQAGQLINGGGEIDPGNIDLGNINPGDIDPGNIDPGNIDPGTIDPQYPWRRRRFDDGPARWFRHRSHSIGAITIADCIVGRSKALSKKEPRDFCDPYGCAG